MVVKAPAACVDVNNPAVDVDWPAIEGLPGRHKLKLGFSSVAEAHKNPDRREAIKVGCEMTHNNGGLIHVTTFAFQVPAFAGTAYGPRTAYRARPNASNQYSWADAQRKSIAERPGACKQRWIWGCGVLFCGPSQPPNEFGV